VFQTSAGSGASLTPTSLTFATRAVGTTSASQTLTLTNNGTTPVIIDSFHEANNADFNMVEGCGPYGGTLAPGASCHIWVTFSLSTTARVTGTSRLMTVRRGARRLFN